MCTLRTAFLCVSPLWTARRVATPHQSETVAVESSVRCNLCATATALPWSWSDRSAAVSAGSVAGRTAEAMVCGEGVRLSCHAQPIARAYVNLNSVSSQCCFLYLSVIIRSLDSHRSSPKQALEARWRLGPDVFQEVTRVAYFTFVTSQKQDGAGCSVMRQKSNPLALVPTRGGKDSSSPDELGRRGPARRGTNRMAQVSPFSTNRDNSCCRSNLHSSDHFAPYKSQEHYFRSSQIVQKQAAPEVENASSSPK
jgi:hypothetical protein